MIDVEQKFLEGLAKRERELAEQRAAELAERERLAQQDQRGTESETAGIPEHPRIPAEQRIRRVIRRMFPGAGRGGLQE